MSTSRPSPEDPADAEASASPRELPPEIPVPIQPPVRPTLSPAELDALVERSRRRFAGIRFTPTAKQELDGLAGTSRTYDQCTALLWRQMAALHATAPEGKEEFVDDEISLMTRWSLTRAGAESAVAVSACSLAGLVESLEDGTLTHDHVRRMVRELDRTPDLDEAARQAITMIALYRYTGSDPVSWAKKVRELIAKVDPAAAAARNQAATQRRQVVTYPVGDGQSSMVLTGPTERIAAAAAVIRTKAAESVGTDETLDARMFDAAMQLLSGDTGVGLPVDVHVDLVVPYSISEGSDYELADVVGYGPILPSTARELLDQSTLVRRVAVDEDGHVISVTEPVPGPGAAPRKKTSRRHGTPTSAPVAPSAMAGPDVPSAWERWAGDEGLALIERPVVHEHLATGSYVVSRKLKRYLEARDRRCTFPGCTRPASMTDKDHAIPWPIGPTDDLNCGCLCRHHHRAKQAAFSLERLPDGVCRWTTRGGHVVEREPEAF